MRSAFVSGVFAAAALLAPGTSQALDISVNFANAETNFGTVNTSLYALGSLYFQQRGASDMTYLMDIDSPDAKRANVVAASSIESSAPKGMTFSFGFSGFESLSQAAIAAEAKRSARLYIRNVTTEQYAAPLALLNSPTLAPDRALFATFCPSESCRFVFIYHVTKVDEGGFGFGKAVTVGGKLTFPSIARIQGIEAKIGYDNAQALNWAGTASPMFYRLMRVVLVKKGEDLVFLPDIPKKPLPKKVAKR